MGFVLRARPPERKGLDRLALGARNSIMSEMMAVHHTRVTLNRRSSADVAKNEIRDVRVAVPLDLDYARRVEFDCVTAEVLEQAETAAKVSS